MEFGVNKSAALYNEYKEGKDMNCKDGDKAYWPSYGIFGACVPEIAGERMPKSIGRESIGPWGNDAGAVPQKSIGPFGPSKGDVQAVSIQPRPISGFGSGPDGIGGCGCGG